LLVGAVHAAVVEAIGHSAGRGTDIASALRMRSGVGRVWAVAFEHVAHALLNGHGFSV